MRVSLNKVRVRELADGTLSGSFTIDSVDEGLYDVYKHKMRGGALPCLDFLDSIGTAKVRPPHDDLLNDLEDLLHKGLDMINREKPDQTQEILNADTESNKLQEVFHASQP